MLAVIVHEKRETNIYIYDSIQQKKAICNNNNIIIFSKSSNNYSDNYLKSEM